MLVVGFAIIYYYVTAVSCTHTVSKDGIRLTDLSTAIYFSITTLTSTGYGDWTPNGALRFFANAEMIAGYILFGSFISALVSHLSQRQKEPDLLNLVSVAIERAGIPTSERESLLAFVEEGMEAAGVPVLRAITSRSLQKSVSPGTESPAISKLRDGSTACHHPP
jgi:cation transport ATPase